MGKFDMLPLFSWNLHLEISQQVIKSKILLV